MTIRNITYLLFLFFVATTVALDGMLHTKYMIIMVAVTLLLFSTVFLFFLLGDQLNKMTLFHIFIYLYFLWSSLSFIWTSTPESTAWKLFLLNIYFMLQVLVFWYVLVDKNKLYHAYSAYVIAILFLSLVTIYNFFHGIQEEAFTGRFTAYDIGSNEISITLAIGLLISLFLINIYKSIPIRIFLLSTIPIFIFSIFLTGSKTGFIVLLVALIFAIYQLSKTGLIAKVITTVTFFGTMAFLYHYIPKELTSRIFSTGHSISTGNFNEREVVWQIGFEGWKENPLFGSGVSSFERMSNLAHLDLEAHNTYLSILVEYGVIGFIFYSLLIIILTLNIIKLKSDNKYFLLFLMLQILLAQSTMNLQDNTILWALYSLMMSHCWLQQSKNNNGL